MRLDKFLKESRIIKRRTVAASACENGRIKVNGKVAKPALKIKENDIIEIQMGQMISKVKVTDLIKNPKKEDATQMYELLETRDA